MAEMMQKHKNMLQGELLDLTQEIALLSPTDTPLTTLLYSMGKTVPASDITVSWREKKLHTPAEITANLMLEGADAPDSVQSTREMKSNICQIMSKATSVSGTVQALSPYGIGDVYASEIQDRLIELKRDMEYFFLAGTKAVESGVTPRQMNGLINLIHADNVVDAKNVDCTEEMLVEALQHIWDAGVSSDGLYAFCNATVKKQVNKILTSDATKRITANLGARHPLGLMVDKVVSDFGDAQFVLDRWMPDKTILIVDLNQVEIANLRNVFYQELAKTGDFIKGQILAENTIKLLNSKAGAKIINLGPLA